MKRAAFVITATTTRADIEAEITELRRLQRAACIPSTAAEYADEADELLETWQCWVVLDGVETPD